ncbi:MAG: hypothetical protein Q3988_05235 [Gemella sp.]|nr:hypothetical protein [Gemella sp.]
MNNKKLLLGLTVLATPFVVENLVETNVASANQAVATQKQTSATTQVAKSSEYVLNKPAKAYVIANDAAKRVNQKATYKAGTYYVYNQSKGMVNISKATGKAGSWINPVDNPNAKVATTTVNPTKTTNQPAQTSSATTTNQKPTPIQKAGQYTVQKTTDSYVNAIDASKKVNAKGKVSAGNYYIFREYKGMLNVSRAQGKVGSWINPGVVTTTAETTAPTKPAPTQTETKPTTTTQTSGTKTSTGTFALTSETQAYQNAVDASKKVNARGKVSVGTYHIFREYKGMLNVTKAKGKPGSWINPGVVTTTTETTTPTKPEPTKPTPAPTQTETKPTTTTQTLGTKTSAGTYKLTSATEKYVNAADASKKSNAKGKLAVGDYHIFREYKGMLNLSKVKGRAGSWINPVVTVTTKTTTPAQPQPTKPTSAPTQTETKPTTTTQTLGTKTSAGTYKLTNVTEKYVNAADASKKSNSKGTLAVGDYHIFREYKGMLNLSNVKGKPGSWINPLVPVANALTSRLGVIDPLILDDTNSIPKNATNLGGLAMTAENKKIHTNTILEEYKNELEKKYGSKFVKSDGGIVFENGKKFTVEFGETEEINDRYAHVVTLKSSDEIIKLVTKPKVKTTETKPSSVTTTQTPVTTVTPTTTPSKSRPDIKEATNIGGVVTPEYEGQQQFNLKDHQDLWKSVVAQHLGATNPNQLEIKYFDPSQAAVYFQDKGALVVKFDTYRRNLTYFENGITTTGSGKQLNY